MDNDSYPEYDEEVDWREILFFAVLFVIMGAVLFGIYRRSDQNKISGDQSVYSTTMPADSSENRQRGHNSLARKETQ